VNRQAYETHRFTIGDDVALAHVGPPSDLAEARRTAIAFLLRENEKTRRVTCPQLKRDMSGMQAAHSYVAR